MANQQFILEDSTGKIIKNPTEREIREMIFQIGKGLDHCILSSGDSFIQSAGSERGLFVETKGISGRKEKSRNDYTPEEVAELFFDFLNRKGTVKESSDTEERFSEKNPSSEEEKETSKMDLKEEAKNFLKNEGKRSLRRVMRKGTGLLSRKRFPR